MCRILTLIILSILILSCGNELNELKYLGQNIPENQPEIFGKDFISVDSTGEWKMSSSFDGFELYFPRNIYLSNGKRRVKKYYTKFDGEKWITPQEQNKFFRAPYFLSDTLGIMIYKNCVWKTLKNTNSEWSDAIFIDSLYFGRDVTDWHISNDLNIFYVQDGELKKIKIMESGVSKSEKLNGFGDFKTRHVGISPEGDYLLCDGYIEEINTGWVNLYISFRKEENEWTFPKRLDNSVNTKGDGNYLPKITPDGRILFFTRSDSTDRSDIYWISTKGLEKYK